MVDILIWQTFFNEILFLFLKAKPKITYVENKTAVELDNEITLTCEASGDPLPSITWRTATRNISEEDKVRLS